MDESCERYHQQPVKAKVWEHAERNAIFYAARLGAELYGCGLAVNWYPCSDCARAIVQSGIIELVAEEPHWKDEKRGEDWLIAREILTAAGINIIYIYPNTKETEPLLETVLA
jgi:dCMP deaminase